MRKVKRLHIKRRPLVKYMEKYNKEANDLTEDEMKQFEGQPLSFGIETSFPMSRKGSCYICGKKTGWLDKIHTVYNCSKKCMEIIDNKYNNGETIIPDENGKQILDEVAKGLFE